MLSPQLEKLKLKLEGKDNIDKEILLDELKEFEAIVEPLQESLSLSRGVYPTCGGYKYGL